MPTLLRFTNHGIAKSKSYSTKSETCLLQSKLISFHLGLFKTKAHTRSLLLYASVSNDIALVCSLGTVLLDGDSKVTRQKLTSYCIFCDIPCKNLLIHVKTVIRNQSEEICVGKLDDYLTFLSKQFQNLVSKM